MTDRNAVPFYMALPRKSCEVLDQASVECFGKPLEALAKHDPLEAYMFLRRLMVAVFSVKPDTDAQFTFEDGLTISSEQDGGAAAAAAVNRALEAELGSMILQPVDVALSAMKTADDVGGTVLKFRVEPPDYAF